MDLTQCSYFAITSCERKIIIRSPLAASHGTGHPGAAITCLKATGRVPELAAIAHAMRIIAGV
jgi:hypothetical protein